VLVGSAGQFRLVRFPYTVVFNVTEYIQVQCIPRLRIFQNGPVVYEFSIHRQKRGIIRLILEGVEDCDNAVENISAEDFQFFTDPIVAEKQHIADHGIVQVQLIVGYNGPIVHPVVYSCHIEAIGPDFRFAHIPGIVTKCDRAVQINLAQGIGCQEVSLETLACSLFQMLVGIAGQFCLLRSPYPIVFNIAEYIHV